LSITEAAAPVKLSWRELVVALAALAAVAAAELFLTGAWPLLTGHYWEDEFYTRMMVTDPSLFHALDALWHGAPDQFPPGGLLLYRAVLAPFSDPSEAHFRLISLTFAVLAVTAVYALARELLPPLPAFAVTLAAWSHPLVLRHAFEARYYAAWLAACLWLLVALRWRAAAPGKLRYAALLAACAVAACGLHWFGCLAVGLAVLGHLALAGGSARDRLRAALPVLAGVPVVLACLPFALAQRREATVPTWIPPLGPRVLFFFAFETFGLALLVGWGMYGLAWFLRLRGPRGRAGAGHPARAVLAGAFGMALLPLALVVISAVAQPAMLARYALPGVAALLVPLAAAFRRLSRPWVATTCAMFVFLGAVEMSRQGNARKEFSQRVDGIADSLRRGDSGATVVFASARGLLPVAHYAPDLGERCALVVAGQGDAAAQKNLSPFAAALADRCRHYYGLPRTVSSDEIGLLLPAYLVIDEEEENAAVYRMRLGGGVWPAPVEGPLYRLVPFGPRGDCPRVRRSSTAGGAADPSVGPVSQSSDGE
jgi:hypothetical protein